MPETGVQDNTGLEAVVLSHRDYAMLLTILRHQVVAGAADEDDFALALGSLIAEDLTGEDWTYAPATGKWYMVSRDPWEEGEPRGPLLVAMPVGLSGLLEEITGEIQHIENEVRRDLRTERMPEPPVADATPATATGPAFCTRCGRPLEAGMQFCPGCGHHVEPTPPAGPRCPGCGQEVAAELAFCVFCGTRIKGEESDG